MPCLFSLEFFFKKSVFHRRKGLKKIQGIRKGGSCKNRSRKWPLLNILITLRHFIVSTETLEPDKYVQFPRLVIVMGAQAILWNSLIKNQKVCRIIRLPEPRINPKLASMVLQLKYRSNQRESLDPTHGTLRILVGYSEHVAQGWRNSKDLLEIDQPLTPVLL